MFYVTGVHYSYMQDQFLSWFFLVCIVLPNLVFLLYWAYSMRIEILKEVYRAQIRPLLFKVLACTSPEAFYEKYMRVEDELAKSCV